MALAWMGDDARTYIPSSSMFCSEDAEIGIVAKQSWNQSLAAIKTNLSASSEQNILLEGMYVLVYTVFFGLPPARVVRFAASWRK